MKKALDDPVPSDPESLKLKTLVQAAEGLLEDELLTLYRRVGIRLSVMKSARAADDVRQITDLVSTAVQESLYPEWEFTEVDIDEPEKAVHIKTPGWVLSFKRHGFSVASVNWGTERITTSYTVETDEEGDPVSPFKFNHSYMSINVAREEYSTDTLFRHATMGKYLWGRLADVLYEIFPPSLTSAYQPRVIRIAAAPQ